MSVYFTQTACLLENSVHSSAMLLILYCFFNFFTSMRIIALIFMCGVGLSKCMLNSHVTALNYVTKSTREVHKFPQFLPLFKPFSLLCMVSKNINITQDDHKNHYIPVVLKDSIVNLYESCSSVVVFSFNISQECLMIKSYSFINSLFFVSSTIDREISNLEQCLSSVSTPEVIGMSLEEGLFYKLSPAYLRPRYFSSSRAVEVLSHRHYPTKTNLQGANLSVATMVQVPFFIIENQVNDEYDGIEENLVQEMGHQMNFCVNYLIYKRWGSLMRNGTWVGHIAEAMAEGAAEIAVANIWQTPSIYSVMDFGPSMSKVKLGFAVRRPERRNFQWQAVLSLFEPGVWFATLVSFISIVIAYSFSTNNFKLHSYLESWCGSIMVVLGNLTMTSFHFRKRDCNTRHTLNGWSIFSLLFTTYLSTGIVTRY